MPPETIKLLSTIISIFNLGLITLGTFGTLKWVKNSISNYQLKDGRYCYGCNSQILPDDEYFKNWASNWVQGGLNSNNPNQFKPEEGLKLCQRCERDQKLTQITNSCINKIKIRKYFIENDAKINLTMVSGLVFILILVITLSIIGIKIPILSLIFGLCNTLYWIYFILKSRIYLKSK